MKELNGREIADFMKESQSRQVRQLKAQGIQPKLVIIRDSDNPVIAKYVSLKQKYGEDIGVDVQVVTTDDIAGAIQSTNQDSSVHGVIVQLPLKNPAKTDDLIKLIAPEKDVDGLASDNYDSATATAINWLLAGYDIDLNNEKIALVGHGRLIGAPLAKMWQKSGYDITVFDRSSNLADLAKFDIIVTATGVPHLIQPDMIKSGAVIVDAGTTSENGILVGDVDDSVRETCNLAAITPKIGGVGPLTVTALFEHVLIAARKTVKN